LLDSQPKSQTFQQNILGNDKEKYIHFLSVSTVVVLACLLLVTG
jgi:hypothetical protein